MQIQIRLKRFSHALTLFSFYPASNSVSALTIPAGFSSQPETLLQGSPHLGAIGMDSVKSEPCYKEQFYKETKFSQEMTMFYPNPVAMCYKGLPCTYVTYCYIFITHSNSLRCVFCPLVDQGLPRSSQIRVYTGAVRSGSTQEQSHQGLHRSCQIRVYTGAVRSVST